MAILALAVAISLAGACRDDQTQRAADQGVTAQRAPKAGELTPEQLGEIGAEIRKDPGRAGEILARRGLDHRSFERQIRDVTESPEAAKRYAAAYRRASA